MSGLNTGDDEVQAVAEYEQEITEITTWWRDQKFNKPPDPKRIRKFLIGSKGRVEKAKSKLTSSADFRKSYPKLFDNRDPLEENIVDFLNIGVLVPLPNKDRNGQSVLLSRPYFLNAKTHTMDHLLKAGLMGLDLLMETDENTLVKGVNTIVDLSNCSLAYVFQLTPRVLYKCMRIYKDGYPILFKGLHLFNVPRYLNPAIALFKTLLPSKLSKRLQCHRTLDDLYKYFDKNVLPKEYEGECNVELEELIQRWKQTLVDHSQRFQNGEL